MWSVPITRLYFYTTLPRNPDDYEVQQEYQRFQQLSKDAISYLVKNDGLISSDPYKTLLDAGIVTHFSDFFYGNKIVQFDVFELPYRVNINIEQNIKIPFFYLLHDSTRERWICYLDGSCEREKYKSFFDCDFDKESNKYFAWNRLFHREAGYPYWASHEERDLWYKENKNKLVWDSTKGLYVLQLANLEQQRGSAPAEEKGGE